MILGEASGIFVKSLTVLYVEDDFDVREQLSQFLKRRVSRLLLAENGQEGLNSYRVHRPDLIITDILMPIMDGLEMSREIRKIDQEVPIIVTTAFEQTNYLLRSIEIGIDKYIVKPINTDLLTNTIHDCAARIKEREDLRLAAKVFDNSLEAILITDANNNICLINPAFTEMTGYSEQDVIGKNPQLLSSGRHDGDFYREMWQEIQKNGSWKGEIWNQRKNGDIYPEWLSINLLKNQFGEVTHYVGIFSDISERKAAEEKIRHLAHHDPLTSLPNRNMLYDRMKIALANAQRKQEQIAVLLFDLDNFKNVNDTFGHQTGDALLVKLAEKVNGILRAGDTFCRLGGDEFVVVLTEITERKDVERVAENLLKVITPDLKINGVKMGVTPSIGIAFYPKDGNDLETLLKQADISMYVSKRKGGNIYQFYEQDEQNNKLNSGG